MAVAVDWMIDRFLMFSRVSVNQMFCVALKEAGKVNLHLIVYSLFVISS